jgi:hypothetical protein
MDTLIVLGIVLIIIGILLIGLADLSSGQAKGGEV